MSAPTAQCPHCFAAVSIPDGAEAVTCPSCEHTVRPDAAPPPPRPAVPLARRYVPAEFPPPLNARRHSHAEDDRPAKRKRSSLPVLLAIGGVLALLVIGGAVAVAVALLDRGPT